MPNRIIRDALLDSERYLELTHDSERLLFIELLLCMDDYGLVPVNFTVLRRKTSVCVSKTKDQVLKMLSALADADLIRVYEHNGSRYAYVPRTMGRPQAINPKWPMPPPAIVGDDIANAQRHARNLGRRCSPPQANQQLSTDEQCGNTVATVYERANTSTSTNTSTKELIPIAAAQLVQQPPQATAVAPDENVDEAPNTKAKRAAYSVPDCPYDTIVDAYHDACPALARAEIISTARRAAIKARWREVCANDHLDSAQGIELFRSYYAIVGRSKFLLGKVNPRPGQQQPWRASFDWLLKPANFVKVLEGTYQGE